MRANGPERRGLDGPGGVPAAAAAPRCASGCSPADDAAGRDCGTGVQPYVPPRQAATTAPAPLQTVTAASAQYSSPARRIIVASTSAADSVSATLVYSNPPRFRCVTLNGIFGYRR
jgi:hypothetical protein